MVRKSQHRKSAAPLALVSALAAAMLATTIPARADMVHGRVYAPTGKKRVPVQTTCKFTPRNGGNGISVRTDRFGRYRAYLTPGIYNVKCRGREGRPIRVHPQPNKQNIYLR